MNLSASSDSDDSLIYSYEVINFRTNLIVREVHNNKKLLAQLKEFGLRIVV